MFMHKNPTGYTCKTRRSLPVRNPATGKLYVKREEMKMDRQKGEHKKITEL